MRYFRILDSEEFHEHAGDIIIDTQSCVYIGLSTAHRWIIDSGCLPAGSSR